MSQSPTDPRATHQTVRYKQGWRALNRLLHEDFSFSGRERNCAFLNVDGTHFAQVASVTGLDLVDDGRALVASDWDFDGDLDLWLSARTAPRLRFMLNRQSNENHFVAFRLQGDGVRTNRDAIGSRIEVFVEGSDRPFACKTLHAGDSFLSQSGGWIHVGLGPHASIDRVVVLWPGGEAETIDNVPADAFHRIIQHRGRTELWQPPSPRATLSVATAALPTESDQSRVVLPFRLPLPRLTALADGDTTAESEVALQGPTLLNLWSSQCLPCLDELAEWSGSAESLQRDGLSVVALNTDRLDESAELQGTAPRLIEQLQVPFPWHYASRQTVQNLDCFQRGVMDRWQPLPVPCSFLVDGNGAVAVIYRGRVAAAQIIEDLALLEASPDELRRAGQPFAGRWLYGPPSASPTQVSKQMIDHGDVAEAIRYLQTYVRLAGSPSAAQPPSHSLADVHYVLGVLLADQQRMAEAVQHLSQAVAIAPQDFRFQLELGQLQAKVGDDAAAEAALSRAVGLSPDRADALHSLGLTLLKQDKLKAGIAQLRRAVEIQSGYGQLHADLADALRTSGDWPGAIEHYQIALDCQPDLLLAANNLAWILATHSRSEFRNGEQAVAYARRVCEQTQYRHPVLLDTLAVALAESGDFDGAAEYETKAIAIAVRGNLPAQQREKMQQRLEMFRQRKPYREVE